MTHTLTSHQCPLCLSTCNILFTTQLQIEISDRWAQLNAQLSSLPPVTDPDPYAVIRKRLMIAVREALTRANELGGLA